MKGDSISDWEELLENLARFRMQIESNNHGGNTMNKEDLKLMKAAIFEATMKAQGKDIPYLEPRDIDLIMMELHSTKGGKLNLSSDAYNFYHDDIIRAEKMIADIKAQEEREKSQDYLYQVEKDIELATKKAIESDNRLPWQLRRSSEQIKQEVKAIVGQPMIGSLDYREKLEKYLGVKDGEISEDILNARSIQKDFEQRQAEKKKQE